MYKREVIKVYGFLAIVMINRDPMNYSHSNPRARDVIEITREKISFALAFASVSTSLFQERKNSYPLVTAFTEAFIADVNHRRL